MINKAVCGEAAISINCSVEKWSTTLNATPLKTENHKMDKSVGTIITPRTNSLIVRPFEIRAIKIPTNGAQDSHQAQ